MVELLWYTYIIVTQDMHSTETIFYITTEYLLVYGVFVDYLIMSCDCVHMSCNCCTASITPVWKQLKFHICMCVYVSNYHVCNSFLDAKVTLTVITVPKYVLCHEMFNFVMLFYPL